MVTLEGLQKATTPRTRALYVIHPFGWPQPLKEIDAWRREQGLLLIEDCALALFSSSADGSPIGSTGDVSVFSFPKSLATPDGGAISWTTNWSGPGELRAPPLGRTLRRSASLAKAWYHRRPTTRSVVAGAVIAIRAGGRHRHDIPADYYFETWRTGRAPCRLTLCLLADVDPASIRERRRRNYRLLTEALQNAGLDAAVSALAGRRLSAQLSGAGRKPRRSCSCADAAGYRYLALVGRRASPYRLGRVSHRKPSQAHCSAFAGASTA